MGLFDTLRGQFVDVIEWHDDTRETLAFKFERQGNEIKNGAKLIVRPGQVAVFISEGTIADTFAPGMHTLETKNLPILSTLQAWQHGFNSPFKAEVFFFATRVFPNQKWGTATPIIIRDIELGPVRVRSYGTFSMRVADPVRLLTQLVATNPRFETDDISEQLRGYARKRFAEWIASSGIAVYDLASRYTEIGAAMKDALAPDFAQYGLEINEVTIENVGLPAEVERALDKRTEMAVIGDLDRYTQFQAANAFGNAGSQPGSSAAVDIALGVALAEKFKEIQKS